MNNLVPPPPTSGKTLMERVEDALLPLINLVFLLLMFFIVAGQISDDPLPELPTSAPGHQEQQPYADLVVTEDGTWQIGSETVVSGRLLNRLPAPNAEQPLKIAAAASISMADLENLFRQLEQGGYTDILLLTEPAS
ncbi:ExbD/TolR family protein [Marinobacter nitratireducens]|nr:biopolymer transporter ExbD [Marinobacter nitratireducens]